MKKHKLLLISYLFPPAGGISVQRALSLARYLPDSGFEVHVMSAANAAAPTCDPTLLQHIPKSVRVHHAMTLEVPFHVRHRIWSLLRTRRKAAVQAGKAELPATPRPSTPSFAVRVAQRVLCPEPEVVWAPFAIRKASQIVRQHDIDSVLVTAPPFSAFLVGNALKRKFPQIRYVADFRDEWLKFYLNNNDFQNNPFARRRATQIERETVQLADLVVAVTHSSLDEIQNRYPDQPTSKFHCVSNGFDPAIFRGFANRKHQEAKLIVTHVGTIYKNASPRYYFDALAQLPPIVRNSIRTRFIGRLVEDERALLKAQGPSVEVLDFMPQAEALRYLEDTDFVLMTMTDRISMPGKFYEYVATGKPILAISPRGSEVDRTIRENQLGWCADPHDSNEIKEMLVRAFQHFSQGRTLLFHNTSFARTCERPGLVARYGALIRNEAGAENALAAVSSESGAA